jgi:hypothetical protein
VDVDHREEGLGVKPRDHGAHDPTADHRPASGKAEWHITYACNLECACCNRASFLKKPHTPDMTLDDAREFVRQATALNWRPAIVIIGGEPTLHHQLRDFVAIAEEFSGQAVQVFSNGHTTRSRSILTQLRVQHDVTVPEETFKLEGDVTERREWTKDIYVSSDDFGEPLRAPCYQHSALSCGVSVDHEGYSPCAMGGAIDALLGCGGRTKVLADLFDEAKVAEMTRALCRHCGHQLSLQGGARPGGGGNDRHKANMAKCETRFGVPMSPTWVKAFEGRR